MCGLLAWREGRIEVACCMQVARRREWLGVRIGPGGHCGVRRLEKGMKKYISMLILRKCQNMKNIWTSVLHVSNILQSVFGLKCYKNYLLQQFLDKAAVMLCPLAHVRAKLMVAPFVETNSNSVH